MSLPPPLGGKSRYVAQRLLFSRQLVCEVAPRNMLDVGCGDGVLLSLVGDQVDRFGVDRLQDPPAHIGSARYLSHDVSTGLPFPDVSFDVVHTSELIEHLPDTRAFLQECLRVLRPDGRLVLSTPNLHYWRNVVEWLTGNQLFFVDYRAGQEGHIRYFCAKTLALLAREVGFRQIRLRTIGDWGGNNFLLKICARLFQSLSTTKNLTLFMLATK
ncbi:MAG: class I SAM-dependent methyltransferase [Desulfobacterales bacterium]|jgi:2-polyprenyl-3-methyl-5-hydroxy-6-metoxy-1,4-benzoquinol methylase|nr:class I SAM-dependent methyltransferase [Desulfobacterales bacterium]